MRLVADVLLIGDFRFPGGTSTAIAAEARALSDAGYRVLLMPLAVPFLARWRGFHYEISELIAKGTVTLVPPESEVRARLVCLHHPAVFEQFPAHPLKVDADDVVLVAHHPPVDAHFVPQYNIAAVREVTESLFGESVPWAPVGPKVRAAFHGLPNAPVLTEKDWLGVIDPVWGGGVRRGLSGGMSVIGRHSRPEAVKWPNTREDFLAAYPDAPDLRVRLMGFGPELEKVVGRVPPNWDVLQFGELPVRQFLSSIDFFSNFHGPDWIEGFGRTIIEAMSAGLVCLLPHDFEPLFGEGAIYCTAQEVANRVRDFNDAPGDYARQSAQAVGVVRELFSPKIAVQRVAMRIGAPMAKKAAPAVGQAHARPRILYFTSNGVGMGHLTRVLASARRHREMAEPIVVSMSRAFGVARDEGIMAEYIPFSRGTDLPPARWHANLRAELAEMFRFYRPQVVALDGNVPYVGLQDALADFPDLWAVWIRRAMWPPGVGETSLAGRDQFDASIEPGELAATFDRGLTRNLRREAKLVAPITYLRPGEALARRPARVVLGLDPDRPAMFLQLGSGNNFRTRELRQQIIDTLKFRDPLVQIVVGQWQISHDSDDEPEGVTVIRSFPFSRFLNAFDFAVAIAGYNTFHENLAAALPTVFLSNDHHEQDEQWLRADYARIRGLAFAARTDNAFDITRAVLEICNPKRQDALRQACLRLSPKNGADEVARYLTDLAYTRRPIHAQRQ